MAKSQTTAQIIVDVTTGELMPRSRFSFHKAREMRRDPTINLCRRYSVAPILAAAWSAEGEPRQAEFLDKQFQPIRNLLLRTALFSEIDFGWKAFELVYDLVPFQFQDGTVETLNMIQRVKPLLNDVTKARYDKDTGEFLGVSTVDRYSGLKIFIDAAHVLWINFDDEGLGNYGMSTMEVAERAHDGWRDADEGAARYDKKIAGTFLVVEFPVGETPYAKNDGKLTDNFLIAQDAVKLFLASGTIVLPKVPGDSTEKNANDLWKFFFLEPQAKQGSFVERQKYLDAQKARAFTLPERSLLEGEFGTKAEAGVHASAALLIRQQHHENITELINLGPVNLLLRTNFGSAGTAWLKAVPLTDEKAAMFAQLLTTLIADPVAGPDIKDKVDVQALLDATGVPVVPVDAQANAAAAPEQVPAEPAGTQPTAGAQMSSQSFTISFSEDQADFSCPLLLSGGDCATDCPLLLSDGSCSLEMCGGEGSGVPGPCPTGGGKDNHDSHAAASHASAKAHAASVAAQPQGRNASSEQHSQSAKAYRIAQKAHNDAAAAHEATGTNQGKANAAVHKYNAQQAKKAAVFDEKMAKAKKAAGR